MEGEWCSNPRPHQKRGGRKLSKLFKQSLLGRQCPNKYAPYGAFFISTPQFTRHQKTTSFKMAVSLVDGINSKCAARPPNFSGLRRFRISSPFRPHRIPTPQILCRDSCLPLHCNLLKRFPSGPSASPPLAFQNQPPRGYKNFCKELRVPVDSERVIETNINIYKSTETPCDGKQEI